MVDLIAVYYSLEQEDSLPKLPPGHRAILTVAGTYSFINHDYLCMASHGGLTYSKFIQAIKSVSYKDELRRLGNDLETISPIKLKRRATFMNQKHNSETGLNLLGMVLLIHHAFINRTATKKVLRKRYEAKDLSNGLSYNVVRASSILAGELQPVPDPPSLLAYLSCANLIFRRWTVNPYSNSRTDDELKLTSYREDDVKGNKVMSIDFDLCGMVEKGHRQSLNDRTLIAKMNQRYGALLQHNQQTGTALPFIPIVEVKTALNNQGFYPSLKVMGGDLPTPQPLPEPATHNQIQYNDGIDESSDEEDEDWIGPGDDDCKSEDEISLVADSEDESDKEADDEGYQV